jgi:threonylcarbamoyladenosine tRNA methylthiotransferase MtaB
MFARSLDLVDACGLVQLHVFPFSLRPGTPAAAHAADRSRRHQGPRPRLREKGDVALRRHLDRELARAAVYSPIARVGHTEQFVPVCLATSLEPGVIVDLTMSAHDGRQLLAA